MSIAYNDTPRPEPHPAIMALKRERERYQKLENFVKWEDELFSNPAISGNHKIEIRATRRAVQRAQHHDQQGRARINNNTIAAQIGVSPDTVSRGLKFLEKCGVITDRVTRPETQENGERWTRNYISLNEELLARPKEITPPEPRNHGGKPDRGYTCQKCGSDKVKIRKRVTLVCKCCKHESLIEETEQDQEPKATDTNDQAPTKNFDEQGGNLQDTIKPVTPPYGAGETDGPRDPGDDPQESTDQDDGDDIRAAAELLLALAGQADEHIEMSRTGQKKYYTVDRPLSLDDCISHLQGGQARGASCSRPDGQTRGLCWDADEAERWELLKAAARQLAEAGYLPILEPSPGREAGGHLLLIYNALVDANAARSHAHQIAPELADIAEYWPGPQDAKKWNRVRLPGGKYVRRGQYVETPVNAWCQLLAVATGESSRDGRSAARLLLANQTPAQIVPAAAPQIGTQEDDQARDVAQQSEPERPALHLVTPGAGELGNTNDDQADDKSKMHAGEVDAQWYARYNTPEGKRLWFAWTPAQLATWYNERHNLEDIRPRERNKMAKSPNGDERTASTAYYNTEDGERWTDFSTHGRRAGGQQDTGDALELQQRLTGTPKPELMRAAARELVQEARQELESAARSGQSVPTWLEQFITDAGRERYAVIAEQAGHQDQAAQIRATCNEKPLRNRNENALRNDSQAQPSTLATPARDVEEQSDGQPLAESRQNDRETALTDQEAPTHAAGGGNWFLFSPESTQASQKPTSKPQRQLRESALAVPNSVALTLDELEEIKAYGEAHNWQALTTAEGEEIIGEGRATWLNFIWLSKDNERQARAYQVIQG